MKKCKSKISFLFRKIWVFIAEHTPKPKQKDIGGGSDEHGCCFDGGYVWCEVKQKCVRIWEEPCASCDEKTKCKLRNLGF
jgi:hypothetical protein